MVVHQTAGGDVQAKAVKPVGLGGSTEVVTGRLST